MKYKIIAVVVSLLVFFTITAKPFSGRLDEASRKYESSERIINYARENLPLEGHLIISNGYIYLKVDDAYIHKLAPMLELADQGFREPPFFRTPNSPGAHISVFLENEHVFPKEVGQIFHFELRDIIIVRSSKYASYAILQVESPELENLRKKYGLKGKPNGHDFHISLAKKRETKNNRVLSKIRFD